MPRIARLTPLLALLLSLCPAGARAEELFPPIERIMGELHAELPQADMEDLRDSLSDQPSQAAFQKAMRSPDPARRCEMVRAMGQSADPRAIPHIAAVLLNLDEKVEVRTAAAVSLGRIGHPLTKNYLVQAIKDPSQEVRFAAVLALGRVQEPGVVTFLEQRLRSDPSWWVRYAVAIALGKTKKAWAVPALERAAREDSQWQVRMEAARALGEIGTDSAVSALGVSLADADDGVRAVSAMALGELDSERGLRLLRAALPRERDMFLRNLLAASIRKTLSATR